VTLGDALTRAVRGASFGTNPLDSRIARAGSDFGVLPMGSLAMAALAVPDATHGVVLTGTACLPLPGFSGHPLLDPPSRALDVARQTAERVFWSFLASHWDVLVRVNVVDGLGGLGDPGIGAGARLILLSPSGVTSGLTRRELEVLGLVVEGCSNQQVARWLHISSRTAAAHVEHILDKLACDSRCSAAVRAVREGTYIPGALAHA
jgi:DNA-binding CsgD family transcriptional regulator